MPLLISRLRRWFAIAAVVAVAIVAGAYFYAPHRVQNVLRQVPQKMGLDIQRSMQGFTFSGSVAGHTTYKVEAKKAVQFSGGGRTELHDVTIILYGRDSSRFDQVRGADFEYDPSSGEVTAKGEVEIDLEANPSGLIHPDQAEPSELKNPIHLRTSNLVFNQKTGNANTPARVDFSISQADGSAVGVSYSSKDDLLTLQSQIHIEMAGPHPADIQAEHGVIRKDPREVVLEGVRLQRSGQRGEAEKAVLSLRPDNTLESIQATGNVRLGSDIKQGPQVRANELRVSLAGKEGTLRSAELLGEVEMRSEQPQRVQGNAGRVLLSFVGKGILAKVHAEENVRLLQHQDAARTSASAQDLDITAAAMDFVLAAGKRLLRAETSGAAQVALHQAGSARGQTVMTAGKFTAKFDAQGQLAFVHGAPDARILNNTPGQAERTSTSNSVDANFSPGQGVTAVVQQGNVKYSDGEVKAWAEQARYTPANQMLVLAGSPRIADQGMETTARSIRINRSTGDGIAEGEVKSTYNSPKPQSGGGLLGSSSPIHVTASSMAIHNSPVKALYTGNVRLWQDAKVIEAPSMEFDKNRRSITATGSEQQPVSTVLVQADKHGRVTPVTIKSHRLIYADSDHMARFEDSVTVKAEDFLLTASQMEVFLQAKEDSQGGTATAPDPAMGKLDRIIAQGQVVITQSTRRATGEKLTYTAAGGKFVLTGGPPSIFDAEQGKITGVSLTLFRGDDRVLVEGTDGSPSVTQTRVAR
jgi:lipopolysaccharide export system protein LptA